MPVQDVNYVLHLSENCNAYETMMMGSRTTAISLYQNEWYRRKLFWNNSSSCNLPEKPV